MRTIATGDSPLLSRGGQRATKLDIRLLSGAFCPVTLPLAISVFMLTASPSGDELSGFLWHEALVVGLQEKDWW